MALNPDLPRGPRPSAVDNSHEKRDAVPLVISSTHFQIAHTIENHSVGSLMDNGDIPWTISEPQKEEPDEPNIVTVGISFWP
jgi:hypothetical protein